MRDVKGSRLPAPSITWAYSELREPSTAHHKAAQAANEAAIASNDFMRILLCLGTAATGGADSICRITRSTIEPSPGHARPKAL